MFGRPLSNYDGNSGEYSERIIFESDSQLIVNFVNRNIFVSNNNIINLIEDIC